MTGQHSWCHSSRVFHEQASEYDSWFNNSLLFEIELNIIAKLPLQQIGPSLEIGVGPGRFARALGSNYGIDPAMAPLRLARDRDITVCRAVGEELPFRSNCLTTISLFFTLCFVQDPQNVLKESYRVLQDGGHLVLGFVPATGKWGEYLQQKKDNNHPFYRHARFLTTQEICTFLARQKFSIKASASGLYQAPGHVEQLETPQNGLDEKSGFAAILAEKGNLKYTV